MLIHLINDLRYAARRLAASPGFTIAAVVTIAIGVGINTGIFSVLNGIAFRDLPVPASDELVGIGQTMEGMERRVYGSPTMFSTAEYGTYRDGSKTLSGLIGYSTEYRVALGGESPQQVGGASLSLRSHSTATTHNVPRSSSASSYRVYGICPPSRPWRAH